MKVLEDNVDVIRKEYQALREMKVASDYKEDGEHSLHKGAWDWHSYVLKVTRSYLPPSIGCG